MNRRSWAFLCIFITLTLDVLGAGIIIPILPGRITTLSGGNAGTGSSWYGVLVAAYALMQFLCAPGLGRLSDRFGRRPVLLIALAGASFDYILLAMAPNLWWLLIGRLVAGLSGASMSVCMAYLADLTPPEFRAQVFGRTGAAIGIGLVLGPLLGGALSMLGPRAPFFAAAVLTALNWLFGLVYLPESLPVVARQPLRWHDANPFSTLLVLVRLPALRSLTLVFLLINLAQQALQSTWVLSATTRFGWTALQNGGAMAVYGITAAFIQAMALPKIMARLGTQGSIIAGLMSFIGSYLVYALAPVGWMMYLGLVGGALCFVTQPALQSLFSQQAGPEAQGTIQGALASLGSLTGVVGPLLATGTFAAATNPASSFHLPGAPFILGATYALLGLLIVYRRPIEEPKEMLLQPTVSH